MRLAIAIGTLALAAGGAAKADEATFDLSGFEAVSVAEGVTATISVGGDYLVRAESTEQGLERLDIKVVKGELRIGRKSKWTGVGRSPKVSVAVSLPALTSLDVSTGSETTATGINTSDFSIDASTGAVAEVSGECDALSLDISTGAELDARELKCKTASVDASTGGDAKIFASGAVSGDASFGGSVDVYGSPSQVSKDTSFGGEISVVK